VTYRNATLDDAELASDLMTASYPALAQDPVITRLRWESPRSGFTYARFIAEEDGTPIAFVGFMHGPWAKLPERHCEVEVWLDRSSLDVDLLVAMFQWIGERALADGSHMLMSYCAEDEAEMLQALAALGYKPERTEKAWQLDLKAHGARLVEDARRACDRAASDGIRLTTLAEWQDPKALKELLDLSNMTAQDVPHTLPILDESYGDFERRMHAPDRPWDRIWIALHGERPVSMSYLKFPPVRGPVWTSYTCTHPDYRGRGLARAAKLQGLAQAVELGVPLVFTDNDSENAPMLHINETLGYVRRPGFVEHHKRVTNTRA
jgi:RimJ/RimL family protein N-acetyltransferase